MFCMSEQKFPHEDTLPATSSVADVTSYTMEEQLLHCKTEFESTTTRSTEAF